MIKALIIDDEARIRQGLSIMLRKHCPDVLISGEADGVLSGYNQIIQLQPDLVFLDIEMEDGTGFELLEKFEEIRFHIIFITAYQEYAVKAFKFSAVDYLLKPVEPDELEFAVNKLRNIMMAGHEMRISNFLRNNKETRKEEKKIVLRTSDKYYFVKISEILYCESEGNYTMFILVNETRILVSRSLKEFEEILTEYGFFRPHKSFLINLGFITGYEKLEGGTIILNDKIRVPVSYRKKEEFLRIVDGM
jgi:two-component system LytT family response regulator